MQPPSPTISSALLTPLDRIARRPLLTWAEQLVGLLHQISLSVRATRPLAERLTPIANNAGLIAAMRGDMQTAWHSTKRLLSWTGRLARRAHSPGVASYAVQPWINLGRLEALGGRWREALDRYATLWRSCREGRLELGPLRVSASQWAALGASPQEATSFIHGIYVGESLKAMLSARQFERVHAFSRAVDATGQLVAICDEARVIAHSKMSEHRAAIAGAELATTQTAGWSRVVMRLRLAEALACAGEMERARPILSRLAASIREVSPEVKAKPELMSVTARLANACYEVGLSGDAVAVAVDVLEGAGRANDEMIRIEMLQLLTAAAGTNERAEGWSQSARAAAEATDYARFRGGAPPRKEPGFDRLYAALESAYE